MERTRAMLRSGYREGICDLYVERRDAWSSVVTHAESVVACGLPPKECQALIT